MRQRNRHNARPMILVFADDVETTNGRGDHIRDCATAALRGGGNKKRRTAKRFHQQSVQRSSGLAREPYLMRPKMQPLLDKAVTWEAEKV